MFCRKCGCQLPEGTKFCQNCGEAVTEGFQQTAQDTFQRTEQELESAVKDVCNTIQGAENSRLTDNRGLLSYILLSLITCGIYSYYFIYKMAKDINVACDGDGETTQGLAAFIILSIITCGIYAWIWYYKLGNRLATNAPRYNLSFQENGTTILMWLLFGSLLCGIGPFVAMHILIKNSNQICAAYNRNMGL